MVQAELPKGILFAGILSGRFAGGSDLVDPDRDTQRRVGFPPDLRVRPVLGFIRAIDHRVEGRVDLPALKDVLGLLVRLVANGVGVGPGSGNQEVQRLHSGIARALGHDIKELPVGLRVQLVEHDAVDVEAMLRVGLRRQHLVEAVGGLVDDPLLGSEDLHAARERRTHSHHVSGHVEYDGGLLAVGSAAIHLGAFLSIAAGKQ